MLHVLPPSAEGKIAMLHVAALCLVQLGHVEEGDVGEKGLRPHVEYHCAEWAHPH